MSARGYVLHSVCSQLFILLHLDTGVPRTPYILGDNIGCWSSKRTTLYLGQQCRMMHDSYKETTILMQMYYADVPGIERPTF